uniref:Golgin A2 n=1 Tax=Fundulus heteroclitus TaxID=8078 RepID=A0A3Q2Q8N2_FUNHE
MRRLKPLSASCFFYWRVAQLKEFQQKRGGSGTGSKKKRKVKELSQPDAPSADRDSPDNVSVSVYYVFVLILTDALIYQISRVLRRYIPLSSTESLRQLSQQLNGLVSEVGCHSHHCHPRVFLLLTLSVSHFVVHQTQELTDQLQKERKEFEQKFSREHGAMREQLQVHIQTIGILVSEKSELQTALQYTQQAARQKTAEAEELNNRLQTTKQRVSELERTLSTVSTQQKQFDRQNKELEKERDNLRLEVLRLNNLSEESKQQSSELSEQLRQITQANAAMRLEVDDLHKRLEMADLMLQQYSSQSDSPSFNQKVELLLEEKQQLESRNHQLLESVAQLKTERDCYVERIQEEGRVWKDKTEQLLAQVSLVAEERDRNINRVQELEASILELQNAAALLSAEKEAQDDAEPQPSGPSAGEVALQEALSSLQQEKDAINAQYRAQLRDNEQLSRLCAELETRLGEFERQVESKAQEDEDRRRMLEDVQSDKATISRALTQNRALKDQLAELQNGFVKLTNENMELTTAIQSEQHVKKELARRMGELQEELHNVKEQLELKCQEAQGVTEQRDQVAAHLQQYCAAYQALAAEREQLHQQFLQQTQLMDRLQHDESHGRAQLDVSQSQLKQEHLEHLVRDNEQLKAEIKELLNSSALETTSRDQGKGLVLCISAFVIIPEDFESQKEMEDFIRGALAQLEAERDDARRQLEEEHRLHMAARQQAAVALRLEQQHHNYKPVHEDDRGGVPAEVHQALQAAMEKLQQRFTSLMQEKADLKERVEELEHRCIQLSGETDTIGEYIALYQSQRAIMKQKHQEKEQYINMLAQDKEEMKVKLAELQDLVMRLVAERNDWYSRYAGAVAGMGTANPDLLPVGGDLMLSTETTESKPLAPREDGTARQIMQLLHEIQNPQGAPRSPPFLGENPCIPFFYRPDEQDEVKILVV